MTRPAVSQETGTGVAVGSFPLFTPVAPPKVTSISHEALVLWRRERREYEAKMRARVLASGEDYAVVTQTVKDSFDADLLETVCEFRLGIAVDDVTDDELNTEIEGIVTKVKNNTLPDIEELFDSELHMDMKESDVEARVLSYFMLFKKIVADNGLGSVFEGESGKKEQCKRLMASLKPVALKDDVKRVVRFTKKQCATNAKLLYDLVLELAVEYDRHYVQTRKRNSKDDEKSSKSNTKRPFKKKKKMDNERVSNPSVSPPAATVTKLAKGTPAWKGKKCKTDSKPPPYPCPKCNSMHWLSDCTKATDVEKITLRQKLREAKAKKDARLKRLGELLPSTTRTVSLNGVLELPYCADSGSDFTVMSERQWKQLCAVDPSAHAEPLDQPIESETYGKQLVTAKWKAMLHIQLHTAAGPVEPVDPVPVLIVDADDAEFIVGADLLLLLGIDVDYQLAQLAAATGDETSGDPFTMSDDEPVMNTSDPVSDADVRKAVEALIQCALENGFPPDKIGKLRLIVYAHDVWRLELRADPPARVPPLVVRLKNGARPTKCKPRKYPPHICTFLHEFNQKLVALGFVTENPTSRWASPVLPVKKSAALMDLRQTTDYRAVNQRTDALAAVMPILSLVVENAAGMKHFGLFDFLKGFWQLPLSELCQEWMSYMTDEKIFTPHRVPQGCCDAAIHFQKTMEECFASLLHKHLLIWIDDLLLYAADIDMYLQKLEELFSLLNEFGLKLSAKKSSLYQTQVKWCGKIIDGDGVRHDPERIDALRAMPCPTTAGELQQFVCAANWMRETIVDYAREIAPFQRRLDDALSSTRRTRRAAAGIAIALTPDEVTAYDRMKDLLATSATLAFPDDSATTCLFTDASDLGWSVVVTQVMAFDARLPATNQQHKLLQCLSGTFTGSQCNWTVIEKEAFPIVMAADKLDYLLLRPQGFRMYCDHRNLIHVFAPGESVKKHVKGKLLRWSMKLMGFNYVIEHVAGPSNVWADMISRWAGNHMPSTATTRLKRVQALAPDSSQSVSSSGTPAAPVSALRPLDDDNFVWPTFAELQAAQQMDSPPPDADTSADGLVTIHGLVWVAPTATDLLQRLCVIAHCGAQGHRGIQAMINQLQQIFAIEHLHQLASSFVGACLLCRHSKGGKMVPRPWSETVECSERNGVLHFDFLFMGESYGASKYLLVLKDHATHYCELTVSDTADSTVTVEALLAWHSRFGLPATWISDNGSHFKNEVVAELSRRLRTQQQFTPAYSPWINGSVERINRDILQVVRTLILEYKISQRDWVYLVPMIQSSLNHTAVPSLGNHAPVELFTGLTQPSPLREFYLPEAGELQHVPAIKLIDKRLNDLRSSIQEMHAAMADKRLQQRLLNKKRERGENLVNFDVGDYVLRSRVDEKQGNKLQVTWVGPYRVTRADSHSFRVQHLVTGDELDIHASRLKFCADDALDVTDELLEHISAQGITLAVDSLQQHAWNDNINDYEIRVRWRGLQPIEDSDEPLISLAREIKVMVNTYVHNSGDHELQAYWRLLNDGGQPAANGWRPMTHKPTAPVTLSTTTTGTTMVSAATSASSNPASTGAPRRSRSRAVGRGRRNAGLTTREAGTCHSRRRTQTSEAVLPVSNQVQQSATGIDVTPGALASSDAAEVHPPGIRERHDVRQRTRSQTAAARAHAG